MVTKIIGDKKVKTVELLNKKTGEVRTFPTEGVFVFIGNIRQVVSGAGEGATAAYYANKYLESRKHAL